MTRVSSDAFDLSTGSDALDRVQHARNRQFDRTRWFGLCLILVGLVLIPSGFSLPWELPLRLVIVAVTAVALLAVAAYIRRHRVVPRSAIPSVATAGWLGISALMGAVWDDLDLVAGFAVAVVASSPFFVAGTYFLVRRAGTDRGHGSRST